MSYCPFNAKITRVVLLFLGALICLTLLSSPVYKSALAAPGDSTTDPLVIDYDENGTEPVVIFAATDPEEGRVFWSLDGSDAADFAINGGVLTFKKPA